MLKNLYAFLGSYQRLLLGCVLLTMGEVACELAIPLLMSRIVDVGIPSGDIGYMARIGGLMVGAAALAILCGVLNAHFSAEASQGFSANLRKGLYAKVESFSFSNIDAFSGASLVTRMTNDVTQLQMALMMSLRMLTRAPIMLVSALFIAMGINRRLSMVIVVSVLLLIAGAMLIIRTAYGLFGTVQRRIDGLNATVQENLIAIRVVKAFVREGYEKLKFEKASDDLASAAMKAGSIVAFMFPMMTLVLGGTTIGVLGLGGTFVGQGLMTTGELLSFISYIMQILMSVMIFSMVFVMLTRARACGERVVEVLDTAPDIADKEPRSRPGHKVARGEVEFCHVDFRYNGGGSGDNALSDISFTARPGEMVGIIGSTGSGKTSLISLIPRFYDVCGGCVKVDGVDVREYAQQDLREGIGMVMQKNNLFSGTIRQNLLWGKEDAGHEEMVRASAAAQAHPFIEDLPKGYDTELGQGGVNLSGGQKQRVCIARALLKGPPILILDDSTSAVDTSTEAGIRKAFREQYKNTTILIVAQRISSVRDADKIIVLDDGGISGIGTHRELLEGNAVYREICASQNEGGAA